MFSDQRSSAESGDQFRCSWAFARLPSPRLRTVVDDYGLVTDCHSAKAEGFTRPPFVHRMADHEISVSFPPCCGIHYFCSEGHSSLYCRASHLPRTVPLRVLLQHTDDVFVCEMAALHSLLLSIEPGPASKWISSLGARSCTCLLRLQRLRIGSFTCVILHSWIAKSKLKVTDGADSKALRFDANSGALQVNQGRGRQRQAY